MNPSGERFEGADSLVLRVLEMVSIMLADGRKEIEEIKYVEDIKEVKIKMIFIRDKEEENGKD